MPWYITDNERRVNKSLIQVSKFVHFSIIQLCHVFFREPEGQLFQSDVIMVSVPCSPYTVSEWQAPLYAFHKKT